MSIRQRACSDRHSRPALLCPGEPTNLSCCPCKRPEHARVSIHSPRPRQAQDETQAKYGPCYDATYAPYTDHVSHRLCGLHYRPSFCHPSSIHLQVQPAHGPGWIGIASRLQRNHYTVESSTHNTRPPIGSYSAREAEKKDRTLPPAPLDCLREPPQPAHYTRT